MFPYVKVAVQYGYIIEILKPNNEWSKSPGILAAKNKHGVPKDKIQRMLMNFEPVTVDELIKINNLNYTVPIPQLRHYPPLEVYSFSNKNFNVEDKEYDVQSKAIENKEKQSETKDISTNNDFSTNLIGYGHNQSFITGELFSKNSNPISSTLKLEQNKPSNTENEKLNEISTLDTTSFGEQTDNQTNFQPQAQQVDNNNDSLNIWTDYDETPETCMQDSKTTCNDSVKNEPKPARNNRIHRRFTNDNAYQEPLETISSDVKDIDWKSYEEESNEFWSKNTEKVSKELDLLSNAPKPKRDAKKEVKGNIFSLLKPTPLNDKKSTTNQNEEDIKSMLHNKLEKHELGCPNESKSFLMLRQIYQNKQLDGLWDLFEKCNGDVNWAIDILLKDDSCVDTQMTTNDNYIENFFNCNCDESNLNKVSLKIDKTNEDKESSPPEKIPRYKSKKRK